MKCDIDLYNETITDFVNSGSDAPIEPETESWYKTYMPALFSIINTDFFTKSTISSVTDLLCDLFNDIIYSADSTVMQKKAADIFFEKNEKRGGCWRDIGLVGSIVEIHAKLGRLKEVFEYDSLLDLFNYVIIAKMCISINRIKAGTSIKCAVVTGDHPGGLGQEISDSLSLNGYCVYGIDGSGICDQEVVMDRFDSIKEKEKRVDLLINNFGTNKLNWLGSIEPDDYGVIDTNLKGPINVVDCLVRSGLGPSTIINICSQTYRVAQRCTAIYCSSKAGLSHATKVMARELAPKGYVVNAIAPGLIEDTKMSSLTNAQVKELRGWGDEFLDSYAINYIPMKRYTSREEVALAVMKLANMPDYVNGVILDMTGGQ